MWLLRGCLPLEHARNLIVNFFGPFLPLVALHSFLLNKLSGYTNLTVVKLPSFCAYFKFYILV